MYPGIDFRLLRYAVVVAEELHFSSVAQQLHVSQPSLSKQILQLEESLGFKLFHRTKQHVEITPAGYRFVADARKALHAAACDLHMCSLDMPLSYWFYLFSTALFQPWDGGGQRCAGSSDGRSNTATKGYQRAYFPGWASRRALAFLPSHLTDAYSPHMQHDGRRPRNRGFIRGITWHHQAGGQKFPKT
jgi:hypothetical protein